MFEFPALALQQYSELGIGETQVEDFLESIEILHGQMRGCTANIIIHAVQRVLSQWYRDRCHCGLMNVHENTGTVEVLKREEVE